MIFKLTNFVCFACLIIVVLFFMFFDYIAGITTKEISQKIKKTCSKCKCDLKKDIVEPLEQEMEKDDKKECKNPQEQDVCKFETISAFDIMFDAGIVDEILPHDLNHFGLIHSEREIERLCNGEAPDTSQLISGDESLQNSEDLLDELVKNSIPVTNSNTEIENVDYNEPNTKKFPIENLSKDEQHDESKNSTQNSSIHDAWTLNENISSLESEETTSKVKSVKKEQFRPELLDEMIMESLVSLYSCKEFSQEIENITLDDSMKTIEKSCSEHEENLKTTQDSNSLEQFTDGMDNLSREFITLSFKFKELQAVKAIIIFFSQIMTLNRRIFYFCEDDNFFDYIKRCVGFLEKSRESRQSMLEYYLNINRAAAKFSLWYNFQCKSAFESRDVVKLVELFLDELLKLNKKKYLRINTFSPVFNKKEILSV